MESKANGTELKTDWILFITVISGAVRRGDGLQRVVGGGGYAPGSSYYFALRQLIWLAVSIPMMMFFKRLHYGTCRRPAVAFTDGPGDDPAGDRLVRRSAQHRWIRFDARRVTAVGTRQARHRAFPRLLHRAAFARHQQPVHAAPRASWRSGSSPRRLLVADLGTPIVLVSTAAVMFCVAGSGKPLHRDRARGRIRRVLCSRGGQALPAGA